MAPVRAVAKNGHLALNERTELPEGTVVDLVPVDDIGEMSAEERAALHESLRESIDQMERGQLVDADEALAELRAHR